MHAVNENEMNVSAYCILTSSSLRQKSILGYVNDVDLRLIFVINSDNGFRK